MLGAFAAVVAWDAAALDLSLARLTAGAGGFVLRDHWLLAGVLHDGARKAAWLAALWLLLGLWWPTGVLRRLARRRRLQWLASTALALLLISTLKYWSGSSCPWDLVEFGGAAEYVSHWTRGADGGPGRCFPAGHASAGFAFAGGYFALRASSRAAAFRWLAMSLAAGAVLGVAQQLRGAHFMSHTLWTAWLCWAIAASVDAVASRSWSPRERAPGDGLA